MKIVTISLGYPGVTRVFKEMEKLGFSVHNPEYRDTLGFADLLILGAWDPSYHRYKELYPNAKRMVLWTSPILQTEHSALELEYFLEVRKGLEKQDIHYIWFGSQEWMSLNLPNTFYAPYPVTLRPIPEVEVQPGHVSLLGPLGPRKNVLTQLIACSLTKKIVHMNNADDHYRLFVGSLGLPLHLHKWMSEEEYYRLVASMELGLQISVEGVESFSFVTFDSLMMDRPCLTTLEWPGNELKVIDYQDPRMIAWRMSQIPSYSKGWWRRRAEQVAQERTSRFKSLFEAGLK